VLCLGYKGYIIKEYFVNYFTHQSDITVDIENNKIEVHRRKLEPWKVTLIDTGIDTFTALRIKKVKEYVGDKTFMLTYGDGVGDIDVRQLLRFHKKSGKYATVTAVQLPGRFGTLALRKDDAVSSFQEKPKSDGSWINGGFFVLEPEIFRYLGDDNILWEKGPIEHIAADGQLTAYRHHGFWKPMDTLRDKNELEKLWQSGNPPWKVWK
jgi:glucose-1-phosphate cytidylyltransferase